MYNDLAAVENLDTVLFLTVEERKECVVVISTFLKRIG